MTDFHKTVVLIPTCKRAAFLTRTLRSLETVDWRKRNAQVIVVENGEVGDAERIVDAFAAKGFPIQFVHYARPSKSEAVNFALQDSHDEFVIFFDDDVVVAPGTIEAYVESAKEYGCGYFFGGPVDCMYEVPLPDAHLPFVPGCTRGLNHGTVEEGVKTHESYFFLGHNWACFASDFWCAGGYDSRLGPGSCSLLPIGDEPELQNRLCKKGCKTVYNPLCRVEHYVEAQRATRKWLLNRAYLKGKVALLMQRIENENICLYLWLYKNVPKVVATYLDASARLLYAAVRRRDMLWYLHYYQYAQGELIGAFLYAGSLPSKHQWLESKNGHT